MGCFRVVVVHSRAPVGAECPSGARGAPDRGAHGSPRWRSAPNGPQPSRAEHTVRRGRRTVCCPGHPVGRTDRPRGQGDTPLVSRRPPKRESAYGTTGAVEGPRATAHAGKTIPGPFRGGSTARTTPVPPPRRTASDPPGRPVGPVPDTADRGDPAGAGHAIRAPSAQRCPWLDYKDELPVVVEGSLVCLQVERLPGGGEPEPVWLWSSATGAGADQVDRSLTSVPAPVLLGAHFHLFRQTLGRTCPKVCSPQAAHRWTWLVITAHTRLRPARSLRICAACGSERPGPGRPSGSKNRHRALRHEAGKSVEWAVTLTERRNQTG